MSDAIESKANNNGHDETALIGRESDVVPGRFGEPLQITHVQYSRGGGNTAPKRPFITVDTLNIKFSLCFFFILCISNNISKSLILFR